MSRRGEPSKHTRMLRLGLLLAAALAAAIAYAVARSPGDRQVTPPTGTTTAGPTLPPVFSRPGLTASKPGAGGARTGVGAGGVRPSYVPGQLVVKFKDGTSARVADLVLRRADADVERSVAPIDVRVVDVDPRDLPEALDTLDDAAAVEYVERDLRVERLAAVPNDSLWSTQWGPRLVDVQRTWEGTTGSPSVVVAVLDTGVTATHPDLAGATVAGYDFVNGDADATDDQGHGTATAGVIAARTNNRTGQAGICWKCSIMPIKVLGANGLGTMSTVAAGIVWAVDHGARVINMSLGGVGTTQTLANAVAYAAAKGAILVAAAGNSGTATPLYPAAHREVLSVAATTRSDELYSWSNHGPSWVDVAAPGCNTAPWPDGAYVSFCGTSSATPVVAGLAGLALSAKPAATAAELERALVTDAVPIPSAVQYGRVSAKTLLTRLGVASAKQRRPGR